MANPGTREGRGNTRSSTQKRNAPLLVALEIKGVSKHQYEHEQNLFRKPQGSLCRHALKGREVSPSTCASRTFISCLPNEHPYMADQKRGLCEAKPLQAVPFQLCCSVCLETLCSSLTAGVNLLCYFRLEPVFETRTLFI